MKTEHKTRSSFRKTPLMAGLVLACGLFTGNSSAQWVVTDPGHTLGTAMDMAQSLTEFMEQARRWQTQVKEFNDALTKAAMIIQNPSMIAANFTPDMSVIPENTGADEKCPPPVGSTFSFDSPASLFAFLVPNPNSDQIFEQYKICHQIVRLENKKYNEIVRFVESSKQRKSEVTDLINSAKTDSTEGAHRATMTRAQGLMNDQMAEMQYVEARIMGFDAAIGRLRRESNSIAQNMINGKKSILGQAVSLGALKGALEIAD